MAKNTKDNKKFTILILIVSAIGVYSLTSFLLSQNAADSIQTSIFDTDSDIKLADYKPCGNTIKCPPPPPPEIIVDENENNETTEDEGESDSSSSNTSSNSGSSSSNNSAPQNTPPPTEYEPSKTEIAALEEKYQQGKEEETAVKETTEIVDSLKELLKNQPSQFTLETADGEKVQSKNTTQLIFVDNLEEAKENRQNKEGTELIIDPSSDSDGDRLSDISEIILYNSNPFEADSDNDGIKDGHEVDYGTDPNTANKPDLEPGITNLDGLSTDQMPLIKGVGLPGEEIIIKAYNVENDEVTKICTVTADKIGKFVCQPDEEMQEGDYYLYSNHLSDKERKISRISVQASETKETEEEPQIAFVNKESTEKKLASQEFLSKYLGAGIVEEFITPSLENFAKLESAKKQIISGKAKAGEIVLITWQSFSINSVVIADASQGSYETLIPKALEKGEHKVYIYAYNPSTNFMRSLSSLIFSKN
jgi:hypothetical protein